MSESTPGPSAPEPQADDDALVARLRQDLRDLDPDVLHLNAGKAHQPKLEQQEP